MLRFVLLVCFCALCAGAGLENGMGRGLSQFTTVQGANGTFSSDGSPVPRDPAYKAFLMRLVGDFEAETEADRARGRPQDRSPSPVQLPVFSPPSSPPTPAAVAAAPAAAPTEPSLSPEPAESDPIPSSSDEGPVGEGGL